MGFVQTLYFDVGYEVQKRTIFVVIRKWFDKKNTVIRSICFGVFDVVSVLMVVLLIF